MIRRTWIARMFAAAAVATAVAGPTHAGIIPATVTVTPDGGNYRYTYSVVLPTNMMLQSGNFFTIYDVNGLVSGTIQAPAGWTATTGLNTTPPAGLTPHDPGTAPDITFTYTGPTIPSGQVGLGNFMFDSTSGTTMSGDFTAQNPQVNPDNPGSAGNTDRNIVSTLIPAPVGGGTNGTTPEPATIALAGLGLPFVGVARLFRRKK